MKNLLLASPVRDAQGRSRNTGKCVNCGVGIEHRGSGGGYWDHVTHRQPCTGKALAAFRAAPAPLTCSCGVTFESFHTLEVHYFGTHVKAKF
jgi:hypothetical protein